VIFGGCLAFSCQEEVESGVFSLLFALFLAFVVWVFDFLGVFFLGFVAWRCWKCGLFVEKREVGRFVKAF